MPCGVQAQLPAQDEAEPLIRRALAIDEAALGPDHSAVAADALFQADVLFATGRAEEAEPLARRALAIEGVFSHDGSRLFVDLVALGTLDSAPESRPPK